MDHGGPRLPQETRCKLCTTSCLAGREVLLGVLREDLSGWAQMTEVSCPILSSPTPPVER